MITRIERLSMKVTSDSESIAREACNSLRLKSNSRWKPRWDEMGATARDAVHRCRTQGLALPPNWARSLLSPTVSDRKLAFPSGSERFCSETLISARNAASVKSEPIFEIARNFSEHIPINSEQLVGISRI